MNGAQVPPILYEDNHLLVVEKPPNMPVQADSSGDMDLLTLLKAYIKQAYNKPGDVYLGLCHRLDRPVGGVMVFARTSKAAARLTAQFKGREAQKRYAAVVCGSPPPRGDWRDFLLAQEGAQRVQVLQGTPQQTPQLTLLPGAKDARLDYHVLARGQDTALVDIGLMTGRKHQIRAQFAAHGYPILYDQRYHPHPAKGQIALWAYALSIIHPTKKERMEFTALPKGEAFAAFPAQVAGLPLHSVCEIAYMDAHVLAVCKRAGVEAADADAGEASLQARLGPYFGAVYPAHRLDANTEGLLLYARSPAALVQLEDALSRPGTQKLYHAVVCGVPRPPEAMLEAWAQKDAAAALLHVYDRPRPGAQPLRTEYRVLDSQGALSLLEVRLHTGRTHQIRAHLAHIGHPVLGDDKYGDRALNRRYKARRQLLLAKQLLLQPPPGAALLEGLRGRTLECMWELELPE